MGNTFFNIKENESGKCLIAAIGTKKKVPIEKGNYINYEFN